MLSGLLADLGPSNPAHCEERLAPDQPRRDPAGALRMSSPPECPCAAETFPHTVSALQHCCFSCCNLELFGGDTLGGDMQIPCFSSNCHFLISASVCASCL